MRVAFFAFFLVCCLAFPDCLASRSSSWTPTVKRGINTPPPEKTFYALRRFLVRVGFIFSLMSSIYGGSLPPPCLPTSPFPPASMLSTLSLFAISFLYSARFFPPLLHCPHQAPPGAPINPPPSLVSYSFFTPPPPPFEPTYHQHVLVNYPPTRQPFDVFFFAGFYFAGSPAFQHSGEKRNSLLLGSRATSSRPLWTVQNYPPFQSFLFGCTDLWNFPHPKIFCRLPPSSHILCTLMLSPLFFSTNGFHPKSVSFCFGPHCLTLSVLVSVFLERYSIHFLFKERRVMTYRRQIRYPV